MLCFLIHGSLGAIGLLCPLVINPIVDDTVPGKEVMVGHQQAGHWFQIDIQGIPFKEIGIFFSKKFHLKP